MDREQFIIRSSPFQFLKRFVVIEFLFAMLPFLLAWLINLLFRTFTDTYESLPFSGSISFNLFSVIIFTSAQVLIIIIAFVSWYFPVYVINQDEIIYQRGNFLGNKKLANTALIGGIEIKQGRLARSLNYGTLHLSSADNPNQIKLKDIPEPSRTFERIEQLIENARAKQQAPALRPANELISGGEHQFVEFKSSLVWDYYQQRANKALYEPIMKTIVAFLNSSGGYLLIGVSDEGQILGLEPDLQTLGKPNLDGFENSFNMSFNKMIGVEFRQYADVAFPVIDEKTICVLQVRPSPIPAYLQHKGSEKFFIRAGNASQSLTISQANRYIQQRF